MTRRLILAAVLFLAFPTSAQAFVVCAEYAGAHAPVPDPHRFEAVIGYPAQCVSGVPCWQYTKGTRSPVGTYPESWYLHAGGKRVRDRVWGFYVMNPQSGWAGHVAQTCAKLCFLDGVGSSGLGRMAPRPVITSAQWDAEIAGLVRRVRAAGKQVLPNSVGVDGHAVVLAAGGQASTEAFTPSNAKALLGLGRVWVTERGDCSAKYRAYLTYAGAGDRFGCFDPPAKPWDLSWR